MFITINRLFLISVSDGWDQPDYFVWKYVTKTYVRFEYGNKFMLDNKNITDKRVFWFG
jgi:hypothetical protein